MPICRPWATEPRRAAALLALGLAISCATNSRPPHGNTRRVPPPQASAAARQYHHGGRRRSLRQKAQRPAGPSTLPNCPRPRRRAFEGLRDRPLTRHGDRARTALDAGKDAFAAQRDAMAKRIAKRLASTPDMDAVAKATAPDVVHGWVPVLFCFVLDAVRDAANLCWSARESRRVVAAAGCPAGLPGSGRSRRLSRNPPTR